MQGSVLDIEMYASAARTMTLCDCERVVDGRNGVAM